jgi:prepilin-type N-terminal cleavage/methylation domain-containing protein
MYPPIDTRYNQGTPVPVLRKNHGFSLIELLIVMGIVVLLASLMTPAFNALSGSGNLSKSASDISDILKQARTYAMGKNTYVYVGIQEVDLISPTTNNGVGRVALATIASMDGTRPYTTPDTLTTSTNIMPLGKVHYFDNLHLTNAESLVSGPNMTGRPNSTNNPSFVPLGQVDTTTSFNWTNGSAKYNFTKIVEFDPQGVARAQTNATYNPAIQNYIELALVPTHGNIAPATTPANQAAVQINGLTGAVRVYRP